MSANQTSSSQIWDFLQDLQLLGGLRAIDVQLGQFICRQQASYCNAVSTNAQQPQLADQVGVLACMLSHEFGRGHICIYLDSFNIIETLSLKTWLRIEPALSQKYSQLFLLIQQWNWHEICQQADVVAKSSALAALPLMLENTQPIESTTPTTNERVYLTRYWHYEQQVANGFLQRSQMLSFSKAQMAAMQQTLARLFKRDYSYLWQQLNKSEVKDQLTRQRAVCEFLDVNQADDDQLKTINWQQVDHVLISANNVADLSTLDQLIPESVCLNWQKVAAAVALTRQFAVISGGPGTGKTTTVAKLLAALIEQAQQTEKLLNIQLVAPTGKAAARLTESIGIAIEQLPIDEKIKALMPAHSSTIHRLLGARPKTVEFKHNKTNPLHLDILVIDEASMVDLPMMFRVLEALPKNARLILLGDKDQLASVEAGAILGDICSLSQASYQADYAKQLIELTGYDSLPRVKNTSMLTNCLCMLRKSYRFHVRSGVGQLAKAINAGSSKQVADVWKQGFSDIHLHTLPNLSLASTNAEQSHQELKRIQQNLLKLMTESYQAYCERINFNDFSSPKLVSSVIMEEKAKSVLNTFNQVRLLCAVKDGEFGVKRMNQAIEQSLAQHGLIQSNLDGKWYAGKPIMVTHNEPTLGLHNGDIGICLIDESEVQKEEGARLRVYFEMPDGKIKGILPSRVPSHEVAFAMTIHKSQGSEFEHTVLLLPPQMNPILTRELIYTGVTRAKSRLNLFANPTILAQSVLIKTLRTSGLSEKLSCEFK